MVHLDRKAEALAPHSRDQSVGMLQIAESLPEVPNGARKRVLADCDSRPHGFEQFALGDQPIFATNQLDQNAEWLLLNRD
jgi:hypothetical protein